MNTDNTNSSKRGRPSVNVDWPEAPFTAQEIHDALDNSISRVSVHAKINRAVDHGELEINHASAPGAPRGLRPQRTRRAGWHTAR